MDYKPPPLKFVEDILDLALPVLITGVTLLVFIQVLLRYVFNAPLMGIEELLLFPATWLYMLGTIKASSEKTQIVARVVEIFLKRQRSVLLLRCLSAAVSSIVIGWSLRWAYDYFSYVLRMEKESPTLYIPTIYYEGVLFFTFIFLLLYTLCEVYEYARLYRETPADAPVVAE